MRRRMSRRGNVAHTAGDFAALLHEPDRSATGGRFSRVAPIVPFLNGVGQRRTVNLAFEPAAGPVVPLGIDEYELSPRIRRSPSRRRRCSWGPRSSSPLSCSPADSLALVFSNLPTLRRFGWLGAFAMLAALVADLLILRPVVTFLLRRPPYDAARRQRQLTDPMSEKGERNVFRVVVSSAADEGIGPRRSDCPFRADVRGFGG